MKGSELRPGGPLRRRVQLRRRRVQRLNQPPGTFVRETRTELRRTSRPRARSRSKDHVDAWIRRQYDAARRRSLVCEAMGCADSWTEKHHTFGRSPEPWASFSPVLVLLCAGHHRAVTGEPGKGLDRDLRDDLRWLALDRLAWWLAAEGITRMFTEPSPRARFAAMIRAARESGIQPGGWTARQHTQETT